MDHQQGFVVGVSSRGRPIKRTCDHFSFIDHRELVMQLVAGVEVRGTDPCICSAFEGSAQGCSGFSWVPKPESDARESDAEESTQGEGQQRCFSSQVEGRWSGPLH